MKEAQRPQDYEAMARERNRIMKTVAIVLGLAALALALAEAAFGNELAPSPTPAPYCLPPPVPNAFTLVSERGDWIKIDADGHVHQHGNVKLDEFSRLFWDAVAKQVPWRPSGCGGKK